MEFAASVSVASGYARGFTELSNGFAGTDDPAGLQAICDRLGPEEITAFADRWFSILPVPLTDADAAAGYWWEISMRQIEVSRTIVFAQPRHARGFFEALIGDNLDIGRPEQVELIFSRHPIRRGRPPSVQKVFKTKVVCRASVQGAGSLPAQQHEQRDLDRCSAVAHELRAGGGLVGEDAVLLVGVDRS